MNQPLVSIIIPIYNTEKQLADCLQSAMDQSVFEIEIIAVDDASTDDSLEILRSFAQKDPRIKILANEKNLGAAGSRNRGMDASTGRWLAFLDSDDLLDPDFCQVLLAEAEKSDADIIKGRAKIIETDGKIHETSCQWQREIMQKSPLCFNDCWWSAIYRADKIRGKIKLHEKFTIAGDLIFLVESISLPLKITCIDDIVYNHRRRENSLSDQLNRALKDINLCIDAGIIILKILNERDVYKTDAPGYSVWTMEALRRLGSFHRAKKDEYDAAVKLCAAKAPQIASLIRCDYPGLKKFLMPPVLKILKDDRLMFARMFIFRCYGLAKKLKPGKVH